MRWPLTLKLRSLLHSRRLLRTFERIAVAQEAQVVLLTRIAEVIAPTFGPPPTETDLKSTTGLSFSRDTEQVLVEQYCDRVHRDTGHDPTEDEIMAYLDELATRH